ncbi:MAG TPA: zinc-binding dehydrogenase [Bryobacterales bacterium]|jgi:NADPH:quinone reductase-like Zn-dependent oxidoreductase|nr:zinc-binding dehydrogenase [Bryobacterales bacterium]
MKAVRIHEHGGPEVLRYEDVPDPAPGPGEVLIRVRACALNHLDLAVRRGIPGQTIPLPHILGSDVAGEIAALGPGAGRVKVGDRVLLAPARSCRQCVECVSGRDNFCRQYRLLGYFIDGGNAEYITTPDVYVLPIPGDLNFIQAAAVPLVFLTAWHMLVGRAHIRRGEDVLVIGASSGVGSAAVQIAKLQGCRVIATAGGEVKLALARELGADAVLDHYRQDIAAEVKRLTARRGVDVVFEHVGEATWRQSVASLAYGGRLITCGATTGGRGEIDIRALFWKQISLLGSFMGTLGELHEVLASIGRKELRPVIDKVFPLAGVRAAHERLEKKEQFGKVVLTP